MKTLSCLKKMADWILPSTCVLCGTLAASAFDLCMHCYEDLPELKNACPVCANKGSPFKPKESCAYCLTHPNLPFNFSYALYSYQPPVTKLIMNLKFGQALANANLFGKLLAMQIKTIWYRDKPLPDVIIPVPLHPKRLKQRGYNQAMEVARPIAKLLNIPVANHFCQRVKNTDAQATLPAALRSDNVKNAFEMRAPLSFSKIAVLDDVITTGETVTEFCRVLKAAGAKEIDIWCCAKA
jgi:ComF family protein